MIDDILARRTLAQRLRGLGATEDELSSLLYVGETPDPSDAGVIDFIAPTLVRVFEGEDSGTTDTNRYTGPPRSPSAHASTRLTARRISSPRASAAARMGSSVRPCCFRETRSQQSST